MTTAAISTTAIADFVPALVTPFHPPPTVPRTQSSSGPTETYPHIFRKMIATRIRRSVDAVRLAPTVLPDDIRDQALHILSFALKEEMCDADAAWQQTRALLFELAPRMEQMGYRHDWIPVLEDGVARSQQRKDLAAAAEFQLQVGILYRMVSDFEQARKQVTNSIENFAAVGDKRGQAQALNELAWIEQEQENYQQALLYVQSADSLLNLDDPSAELERGVCYRVYGQIFLGLNDYERAESFQHLALDIFCKYNDQRRIAWSLNNLALSLSRQQKLLDAIEHYERAACILDEINDLYHLGNVRFNQGWTYLCVHQYINAIDCYSESAAIYAKFSNKPRLSRIYSDMGLAWFSLNDYERAVEQFQSSINIAKEIGDKSWWLNAMDGLAMTLLKLNEFGKAIQILEEALLALPQISGEPNYNYLLQSLNQHLDEAHNQPYRI